MSFLEVSIHPKEHQEDIYKTLNVVRGTKN